MYCSSVEDSSVKCFGRYFDYTTWFQAEWILMEPIYTLYQLEKYPERIFSILIVLFRSNWKRY